MKSPTNIYTLSPAQQMKKRQTLLSAAAAGCASIAILGGAWFQLQGQNAAENTTECMAYSRLTTDIPRAEFCRCYVNDVSDIRSRFYRLLVSQERRQASFRAAGNQCAADALRRKDDFDG